MNRIRAASLAALTVAGLLTAGVGATYAASGPAEGTPFENLIQSISTRFGLDAEEVRQVFDEERGRVQEQRQAGMTERHTERLAQAVTDGDITQAQADLILAKLSEMQAFRESLRDMTPDERQAALETRKDDLKEWATANGIPERFLPMAGRMGAGQGRCQGTGPGNGQGKGMGMGMGMMGLGNR
ncbi:hypothetical protein L0Y59_01995 [Candidatus Uhrbacteria bacterium]|nr:hypothetical protein [Candidatus Uhrbacteria bacterium]